MTLDGADFVAVVSSKRREGIAVSLKTGFDRTSKSKGDSYRVQSGGASGEYILLGRAINMRWIIREVHRDLRFVAKSSTSFSSLFSLRLLYRR